MPDIVRETDTGKGTLRLYRNGIMHQDYRKGVELFKEDSDREMEIYRSEYCREQRHPIFVDVTNVRSTSKESRSIYSSKETARLISAAALLIGNPVSRMLGNFYMGLNRTSMPVKMFTDQDDAFAWLESFLPEK